jgi:hypothetical protein
VHPADFGCARQEAQDVAFVVRDRVPQHLGRLKLERQLGAARHVMGRDVMSAALGADDGRIPEQRREPAQIESRRHDQKPEVLAQRLLALEQEGETEIGVEAALVELVEYDAADPLERGVVLNHPREDSLRDHLDAGGAAHPCLDPGPKAHGATHVFPEQLRHAARDRARCDAAGLEHENLGAPEPPGVAQGERDDGALARPGRCMQQHPRTRRQGVDQGGERGDDGKSNIGQGQGHGHGRHDTAGARGVHARIGGVGPVAQLVRAGDSSAMVPSHRKVRSGRDEFREP